MGKKDVWFEIRAERPIEITENVFTPVGKIKTYTNLPDIARELQLKGCELTVDPKTFNVQRISSLERAGHLVIKDDLSIEVSPDDPDDSEEDEKKEDSQVEITENLETPTSTSTMEAPSTLVEAPPELVGQSDIKPLDKHTKNEQVEPKIEEIMGDELDLAQLSPEQRAKIIDLLETESEETKGE